MKKNISNAELGKIDSGVNGGAKMDKDAILHLSFRVLIVVVALVTNYAVIGMLFYGFMASPMLFVTKLIIGSILAVHLYFIIFVTNMCIQYIPKLKKELYIPPLHPRRRS